MCCTFPRVISVMGKFKEKLSNAEPLYTFDTVYLVPGRAEVEPSQVDISTRFSKNVKLLIPISSSPMDTVTEYEMAVAMALHGGIGVVHRNMPVEEQVETVKRVKETPPVRLRMEFLREGDTCSYALEKLRELGVRCLPTVDDEGRVAGYACYSSLRSICDSGFEPVSKAIVSLNVYNVRDVERARRDVVKGKLDSAAIVDVAGRLVGTLLLQDALEETTPALDAEGRLVVAAAVSPFDIERAKKLDSHVDALVGDVAHFHNINVLKAARKLVESVSADFVAGNIGTYEAAVDTLTTLEKVDGFRVGIAGGSICTTAEVGGAYAPTLWAVASVRDALEDYGATDIPVIADGGIRSSGDAVKALAAGASSVMLGYMLAGTDEASAPLVRVGDRLYKPYRGMASRGAMGRRFAADRYARLVKRVEEGVEGLVPYRGPVARVLRELVDGIRAGLGYAGARSIGELWEKARFGVAPRKTVPKELTKA
jgi:IMP dehydrogenase